MDLPTVRHPVSICVTICRISPIKIFLQIGESFLLSQIVVPIGIETIIVVILQGIDSIEWIQTIFYFPAVWHTVPISVSTRRICQIIEKLLTIQKTVSISIIIPR